MTNFEALLVSAYLRAFLPIFKKQFLHFSLFDELDRYASEHIVSSLYEYVSNHTTTKNSWK